MVLLTYTSIVLLFLFFLPFFFQLNSANIVYKNKRTNIKYGSRLHINKKTAIQRKYKLLFLKRNKNELQKKNKEKDNGKKQDNGINRNDHFFIKKNEPLENTFFRNDLKKEDLFEIKVPLERTGVMVKCYIIDNNWTKQNKSSRGERRTQNEMNKDNIQTDYINVQEKEKDILEKKKKVAKQENQNSKLTEELEKLTKTNEKKAEINKYINKQLLQIMNEIIVLKKKRETEKNEEKTKGKDAIMKWNFYITTEEKPLTCFIYFDLPENTILLKPSEIEDDKFLISINALNDIRRNNEDVLKNIYFKKYNVTFDYIYKNCNFLTLLVNKILDQPYILNIGTIGSLLSSIYIFRNSLNQLILHFLSSQIMWNYVIYNIWFNMYHSTLPLKLFLLKQAFSYSKMGINYVNILMKNQLVKLETYLLNASLKKKIDIEKKAQNKYDKTKFQIATTADIHVDEMDEDGDFLYV